MSVKSDLDYVKNEIVSIREILIDQDKKIKQYEKFYKATYEKAKQHKQENDRYKEKCGTLDGKENKS